MYKQINSTTGAWRARQSATNKSPTATKSLVTRYFSLSLHGITLARVMNSLLTYKNYKLI